MWDVKLFAYVSFHISHVMEIDMIYTHVVSEISF